MLKYIIFQEGDQGITIREVEWSSRSLSFNNSSNSSLTQVYQCNITDETAIAALNRMQTNLSRKGTLVGCFIDSRSSRTLAGHQYKFTNSNSPDYCVDACLHANYKYAGVEYQTECHCGDYVLNVTELPFKACKKYLCPSSSVVTCGGYEAIAIYSTDKTPMTVKFIPTIKNGSSNVKILFLLQLNGRNIRQILRLLRVIFSSKHQYLVHVDRRQQYLFKEMLAVEEKLRSLGFRNFYVLRNRYATIWGASNLLAMVLDSIKVAFDSLGWKEWDFFLNLSESDFPVLSMLELESHLARNKGLNFLSSHGQDTGRFIKKQGLEFIFFQCEDRMWRLGKRENFPFNIRIDGGSDWVVLSQNFLNFSISDDQFPRSLREVFATVLLPVESFFHTLAYNSQFCNRIVKGNLKITNWRRKQGCRCAMLKDIVDWCGCSPLAFTLEEKMKISEKMAKKKPAFFARKFEGLVSEMAIAVAERRALIDRKYLIQTEGGSLMKTWVNFYSATVDFSAFLNAWGRAIYSIVSNRRALFTRCKFSKLLSLSAYKANDYSPIKTIAELQLACLGNESATVQLLIDNKKQLVFTGHPVVNEFTLIDVCIGTKADLKEDILRNYVSPLSDEDEVVAQLWWKSSNASVLVNDSTSPPVNIRFLSSRGKGFALKLEAYDSTHGAQYAALPAIESDADEWRVEVRDHKNGSNNSLLASAEFVVFPSKSKTLSKRLVSKYFNVIDVCSVGTFIDVQYCVDAMWSLSSPDPKSVFP
uniref:protein xylosyltransferase n=1 Tax=Syphacia muris TaxID=451379 RepID=A0A0N5A8E3_9BILA